MIERLVAAAGIFLAANFVMSYIIPAPAMAPVAPAPVRLAADELPIVRSARPHHARPH